MLDNAIDTGIDMTEPEFNALNEVVKKLDVSRRSLARFAVIRGLPLIAKDPVALAAYKRRFREAVNIRRRFDPDHIDNEPSNPSQTGAENALAS
jgi:hypothetical protein